MKIRINATEAARQFSELLNRVYYRRESFLIARGGKAIGELIPTGAPPFTMADLAALLSTLPRPDDEYLSLTEGVIASQAQLADSPWPR